MTSWTLTGKSDYMILNSGYTAVLDTNVIFPAAIRDILFWYAHYDLFTPKWSKNIFDEWKEVMIRKGVSEDEASKRVNIANKAFPFALVKNYESLIKQLELPDPKDRHVLAAAIRTKADVIVTNNLKDFPQDYLNNFGLNVLDPDSFLTEITELNQETAVKAFKELVYYKRNPEMDEQSVLESLKKHGLIGTANCLHKLL